MNLILEHLTSVSGFLNASKTVSLVREKQEFDVQAALIRQTLAAPVLIISWTKVAVVFRISPSEKFHTLFNGCNIQPLNSAEFGHSGGRGNSGVGRNILRGI